MVPENALERLRFGTQDEDYKHIEFPVAYMLAAEFFCARLIVVSCRGSLIRIALAVRREPVVTAVFRCYQLGHVFKATANTHDAPRRL